MIRALTTLAGLACAAALLLLVPDVGAAEGGGLWQRAALFAAAGFVAGAFYQLGGIRRPGVRLNVPLLLVAFLPWTLLAVAICAQRAGTPVWLTDLVHDVAARQRARALVARRSRSSPSWTACCSPSRWSSRASASVRETDARSRTPRPVVPPRPVAVADPPEPVERQVVRHLSPCAGEHLLGDRADAAA